MNITTTFRQMDGTDAVKSYAQTKVSKLQKFLRQSMRADVTLSVEGNEHVAEVHLKSGPTHLHGSERSEDMYASIDLVVDNLETQIRRSHDAKVSRKRYASTGSMGWVRVVASMRTTPPNCIWAEGRACASLRLKVGEPAWLAWICSLPRARRGALVKLRSAG